MKNMAKSILAWLTGAALIGFWPVYFVLGNTVTMELATRLMAGVCLAIFFMWSREAWVSLKRGRRASDFVILGVAMAAITTFLHRETVNWFRTADLRDWLQQSFILPYVVWLMAFGFSVLLIAKGTRAGRVPADNFGWLAFAVFYGIAFTIFATVF